VVPIGRRDTAVDADRFSYVILEHRAPHRFFARRLNKGNDRLDEAIRNRGRAAGDRQWLPEFHLKSLVVLGALSPSRSGTDMVHPASNSLNLNTDRRKLRVLYNWDAEEAHDKDGRSAGAEWA